MKIFGIGLPKTGTLSLNNALKELGYVSHHNPRRLYASILAGRFQLPEDPPWDALTHFGLNQYRTLNEIYPDCKFILTVREKEKWIESTKGQMLYFDPENKHMERIRIDIFGCVVYDPTQFSFVYDQHIREVTQFFNELPPERWLMLDICGRTDAENWGDLCDFLDKPVPGDLPFPHGNNNSEIREELEKLSKKTGKAYLAQKQPDGGYKILATNE